MNSSVDVSAPAPRVNFEQMASHLGKRVKLVGRVEGVAGNTLRVKAADDGLVEVRLRSPAPTDAYVEVEGVVESPTVLVEDALTGFGNNFDMANYNELCKLANGTYRGIFL